MLGYPGGELALKRGYRQLTDLAKSEDGAFPTTAIAARESWLKDSKNREIALNFLRAFTDGSGLARTDAAISKKVLRKYTRVDDEAVLQATFEYYQKYFGETLKVKERSYANLLQLLDHPKAKDVIQSGSSITACSSRYAGSRSIAAGSISRSFPNLLSPSFPNASIGNPCETGIGPPIKTFGVTPLG